MLRPDQIMTYAPAKQYSKRVAYFSMEFAIDQSLKIYSGGLGFLAGSHMRSVYELKQNVIGIGMLWKCGYYDQVRDHDGTMKSVYTQKHYSFLKDTGIVFPIKVHGATVFVKAFLLEPDTFGTAPMFLLSTDIPQNDELSRSICYRLYDSNVSTRVAQSIVLGIGGATLLDLLEMPADIYHMNEGHALPFCFYLYAKYGSMEEVQQRVVFTTHTPEVAGNEEHDFDFLSRMSFFSGLEDGEVREILGLGGNRLNYTLSALKFAKIANGVSQMHGEVSREMWNGNDGICEIKAITNAQNKKYWHDPVLENALNTKDDKALWSRKLEMKRDLFKVVADQTGKLFDPNVLTLVWARRFAGYKRADLLAEDLKLFNELVSNSKTPIQVIWAGKPYPEDYGAIHTFNHLIELTKPLPNCAVLTGYELGLSALLKKGSDLWLNNPKLYREASGTSGMTAAMNGSVNVSIPDGWIPEFAKHGINSFLVEPADRNLSVELQNNVERERLYDVLTNEILPLYYDQPKKWLNIVKQAMKDVSPAFESGRMADEYYVKLFNVKVERREDSLV
jgi:glycogen phosphorylase